MPLPVTPHAPSLSLNTAQWAEEGWGRSRFAKRHLGFLRGLNVMNPPDNSVTVVCCATWGLFASPSLSSPNLQVRLLG